MRHAQVNQTSLVTAWDDVDAVAERLAELPQYLARVAGLAERVRPDSPHLPGAKIPEPLAKQGEALDRAFLRLFVERAVFLKARRQAHRLPEAIDDLNAAVIHTGDHHVKAVRPQVYCGE